MQPSSSRPKKQQRVSRACDLCHRRSIRCRPSAEHPDQQCQNCYDFGIECTYQRPSRRHRQRKPDSGLPADVSSELQCSPQKPSNEPPKSSPGTVEDHSQHQQPQQSNRVHDNHDQAATRGARDPTELDGCTDELGPAWRSFALASLESIKRYLELYMEIVYPIFPLFHGPTLWEKIQRRLHVSNRGFFASALAACALAAARAHDGAAADRNQDLVQDSAELSDTFFAAAHDSIMQDFSRARGLDYLRACSLLALVSMQHGRISSMHHFIGLYATLSATQNFHHENCWPPDLTIVEREERRRLFWSMYTLDIYSSVVFDSFMNSQETHARVRYPTEVSDEDLAVGVLSPTGGCWLRGWNFTTDLYRVLEHLIRRPRGKNTYPGEDCRFPITLLLITEDRATPEIMSNVLAEYDQLPYRFKDHSVTRMGQLELDIYGFQAANIQATLQLVRMTLFSTDINHDVHQKCAIADEVLTTFHRIDPAFLRAISTPLVYHLGGIGQMLASVTGSPLREDSYQRVRTLLVSMADLLAQLENRLRLTSGDSSHSLRTQIQKIDSYVASQRQQTSELTSIPPRLDADGSLHSGMPSAMMNSTGGATDQLEDFQLPHDLIHSGVWPWPFFGQDPQHLDFVGGFSPR